MVASVALDIPGHDELARSWADSAGSHGEGVVFLPAGHLLVAKEKDPLALLEFGPPGAAPIGFARGGALSPGEARSIAPGDHRYVPLRSVARQGAPEGVRGLQRSRIDPDGHLYLLSDKSDSIARLSDLPAAGGTVVALATWRLGHLDGKPEGLAFTPNGRAIVGLDTRKARHNLVLFEPPIATA